MNFTDAQLDEFIVLYKKHFGVEITKQVALEKALRLVRFTKAVLEGSQPEPPAETVSIIN